MYFYILGCTPESFCCVNYVPTVSALLPSWTTSSCFCLQGRRSSFSIIWVSASRRDTSKRNNSKCNATPDEFSAPTSWLEIVLTELTISSAPFHALPLAQIPLTLDTGTLPLRLLPASLSLSPIFALSFARASVFTSLLVCLQSNEFTWPKRDAILISALFKWIQLLCWLCTLQHRVSYIILQVSAT